MRSDLTTDFARQRVSRWVETRAEVPRWWRWRSSGEEEVQEIDGVGDVEVTGIVYIDYILASCCHVSDEEEIERREHVRDVDDAVVIYVAAHKDRRGLEA